MYLKSDNVAMFPSARRVKKNSNKLTEANIVNLMTKIVDAPNGFVISETFENKNIEFFIKGYYFDIDLTNVDLTEFENVFAKIVLTNNDTDLFGQDDPETEDYKGLALESSNNSTSDDGTAYFLKLLEKSNNSWTIPVESKLKYCIEKIYNGSKEITIIDGAVRQFKEI